MEEAEGNKIKLVENQNSLLVWGVVLIVALGVLIWLIYLFREIQIQRTDSRINSIKKEILSQVGEDELSQLETITGQLATLYGKPYATTILKALQVSTPKNTTLTSLSASGGQISLQGTAASYDEVSLFATALSKQEGYFKDIQISNASQQEGNTQASIDFTLEVNLR